MRHSRVHTAGSGALTNHTLDTLFGVKGTIRLVPQSGAPKAHILLKREFYNEESLIPEPVAGVARFLMVANKRFTANKGQTLCLSVEDPAADEDAKLLYGENAVSLEFDYDDESDLSEPEDDGEESEDSGVDKHAKNTVAVKEMSRRGVTEMGSLPARMRKSLVGSSTYNAFAERQSPNSLGFAGYPLSTPEPRVFASAATQTESMKDEATSTNTFAFDYVDEETFPLSPISTNTHISHCVQTPNGPLLVHDTPSESSGFQDMMSLPRSPSPMDRSTTTMSHPGSPEDPPWTSSSPTNDQSSLPLPSTAATTPTPSPKPEMHPQGYESPQDVPSPSNNTEPKHPQEQSRAGVFSAPTHCRQDEDIFAPETFLVEPQVGSAIAAIPLQPCKKHFFSLKDDSATLPTPLATPTPLSRSSNTPTKQRTTQLEPSQGTNCDVQPSPSVCSQQLSTTTSSSAPLAIQPPKVAPSSSPLSPSPSVAVPRTTRPPPTSIPTQPKAHRLLQAHITAVTPTPQPSISNPLGIRPSLNKPLPKGPRTLQAATSLVSATHAQPVASTSTSIAGASTKRPVVVGSKWMPLRGATSTYIAAPAFVPAASGSLTKTAISAPTLKLTLDRTSSSSEISTSTGISTRSKSQAASFDDLLRYTPSPPPSTTGSTVQKHPKSESTHSVPAVSITVEKSSKILAGFVPAATSIGGLLENPASGECCSDKKTEYNDSSANSTLAQNPNRTEKVREDGEMSDDGDGTAGTSRIQTKVGVETETETETETQKRKERKERSKAAGEAANWKEVGSQTDKMPTALSLSLKRPREGREEKILPQSIAKADERVEEDVEGEQMASPSVMEPVEEDMIMETDDESGQDSKLPSNKANVDTPINSGRNPAMIPNNETPNVTTQPIFTGDQLEDMVIESDDETANHRLTKKQKIHDSRDSDNVVGFTDLRLGKPNMVSGAPVSPATTAEQDAKPVLLVSTSSLEVTSCTLGAILGVPTESAEAKQKKKRRKKAKSVGTNLTETTIPCQSRSVKTAIQEDLIMTRGQVAENLPPIATDMFSTGKAMQAAIEKVEREERERAEKEGQKTVQHNPMEVLDMQMSHKVDMRSIKTIAKPHLTAAAPVSAGVTTKPVASTIPRLAHPLPAKPVIAPLADRRLYRPASPIAVLASTAPLIETDRGRSGTRSPARRRTSVHSEAPRTRRGRSTSISSRGWQSPQALRKQARSRGRERSRSDSASKSRSSSWDARKYIKRPYSNSRSRSQNQRRRRARSRSYSTGPSRSPSWSRSRRSTSSIASSRSRSRSVGQRRGRADNSRGARRSRSCPSRGRNRSRSKSRSMTRSRGSWRRKGRYEDQTTTWKASDVLEIKEEVKEAQLPRTKAQIPEVVRVANTDWPATTSNAQFTIKHLDVPSNDVSIQKVVFGQHGRTVAVACSDSTVRLWETKPKIREAAQVSTTSAIAGLCWMDGDSGFLTLCVDGQVALHIQKLNKWDSCKLFNMHSASATPTDVPTSMVYTTGKIAIATPTSVKVWFLNKAGVWQQQRDITRSGVTSLEFLPNGNALVGGCKDGLLWYCEVPNGTLRAYAFMPSRNAITAMDMQASSSHLLVTQEGGSAYLVALRLAENKGIIEKTYTSDKVKADDTGCGAIFATYGQALVFGSTNGCALVWDRKKGSVVYGLKHPDDDKVQAMSSFDGKPGVEGMIVSGTKKGRLFWWPIPRAAPGKS